MAELSISGLAPLATANLREQAAAAIRASIITGELEPGAIYSVRQFADRFGVSATPVREALLDLLNDGLVIAIRNRGFRIAQVTDRDLDEIYRLRLLIEVPGVAMAAEHLSPEDEAACRELAGRITEAAGRGNLTVYVETDRMFHLRLLEAAGNRRLVETVRRLRDETRLRALPALRGTAELGRSAAEHVALLDAVARGDGAEAAIVMRRHLEQTRGRWAGRPDAIDASGLQRSTV